MVTYQVMRKCESEPGKKMLDGGYDVNKRVYICSVCPRILDPFYIVTYYIFWVKSSWIYSRNPILIRLLTLFRRRKTGSGWDRIKTSDSDRHLGNTDLQHY